MRSASPPPRPAAPTPLHPPASPPAPGRGTLSLDDPRPGARRLEWASEAIVLALACLPPWAFGAVEARAQLGLGLGIALLAALGALTGRQAPRPRSPLCGPGLALAGLALLAALQAAPLPAGLLEVLAPATHALRADLVPAVAGRVVGDPGPPVAPSLTTLSLDPEASARVAARLAAAWVLFQAVVHRGGGYASFRRLALAVGVNAALLALFSTLQALTWGGKIYGFRPTPWPDGQFAAGPFVCHNHLAAYLNLGLGFMLGSALAAGAGTAGGARARRGRPARDWAARLGAAYAAGLIVVGLLGTQSRGGCLALAGAAAALAPRLRREAGAGRLGAGLIALALVIPLSLLAVGGAAPFRRLATIPDALARGLAGAPDGLQYRVEMGRGALEAWLLHPVLGAGLGSFPAATLPLFRRDRGTFYAHAEDEYLEVLSGGGVVGLGLAFAGLAAAARLAGRARAAAPTRRDRLLVLGGLLGGLSLAFQCLGDFPLHVPGVAVPALIVAASLCRLGLDAPDGPGRAAPRDSGRAGGGPAPIRAVLAVVGLAALVPAYRLARAEAEVAGAGLPPPGAELPTADLADLPRADLERRRAALERALRLRPDWAEGHLRRGETLLALYARTARDWLEEAQPLLEPGRAALLSDPLRLHGLVHSAAAGPGGPAGALLGHPPVRLDLAPAARSFLEARRCAPTLALAHLRLATLDYLLEGDDPGAVSAARALRLAGPDGLLIARTAQAALQLGDPGLAARCWRTLLERSDADWRAVADAAGEALAPDPILRHVLPPGARSPIRFADRLYGDPRHRGTRDRFLRAALARLPDEPGPPAAGRLWLEAQARARLGERDRARRLMAAALAAEPLRAPWREGFAAWLIRWGDPEGARRQAAIGLQLDPRRPGLRRALEAACGAPDVPAPNPTDPDLWDDMTTVDEVEP